MQPVIHKSLTGRSVLVTVCLTHALSGRGEAVYGARLLVPAVYCVNTQRSAAETQVKQKAITAADVTNHGEWRYRNVYNNK